MAKTPTAILAIVYIEKWNKSLFLSKLCFSKANEEYVVNPPQNPVARNKVVFVERRLLLEENPKITPIKRHPIMFTEKVPKKKF